MPNLFYNRLFIYDESISMNKDPTQNSIMGKEEFRKKLKVQLIASSITGMIYGHLAKLRAPYTIIHGAHFIV